MDLFEYMRNTNMEKESPLAARLRPKTLDEVVGQQHIIGKDKLLYRAIKADKLSSIILYGPPGTGKTTLAKVIANTTSAEFTQINATVAGKKDMEEVVAKAKDMQGMYGRKTILFIDEIHRFNKGQQDYLLPFVEDGTLILIGATTENPYFEVNGALISRSIVFELKPLSREDIKTLLKRAVYDKDRGMGAYDAEIEEDALEFLAELSGGDARHALNAVELGIMTTQRGEDGKIHITVDVAQECIQKRVMRYDKTGDNHYDTISAFIKSMRGSDPDAAVYYLARMLYAGESVTFIARRIMICAAEDVGNADPNALQVAVSASLAAERIGMPEAQIILAQAVTYVASAPKSNSAVAAIGKASKAVEETGNLPIPVHLQDAHYKGASKLGHGTGYLYAHDYPNHYVKQQYLPYELNGKEFYKPSGNGYEVKIREHMARIKKRGGAMNLKKWTAEWTAKGKRNNKVKIYGAAATLCLIALFAGVITGRVLLERKVTVLQAARMDREQSGQAKAEEERAAAGKAAKEQGNRILEFPAQSAKNVLEALKKRPPSVELTEENTEDFVQIASCRIDGESDKIVVETSAEGIPVSDDKYYYLFSIKALANGLGEEVSYIGQEYKDERVEFQTARSGASIDIFRKFLVAVKKDGEYVAVSRPSYITNPGAAAKYHSGRKETSSKKGLLVDPNKLRTSELDDLGVKHASYNIPISRILGSSTDGIHPTIQYNYRGKSYSFNGQVMSEYDLVFGILTSKGIEVTAILLNDISAYPQLIHPMARSGMGSAPYYAFNGSDEEGQEYLAAIGSFLAERYSSASSGRGLVTNWIIGNEINARKEWNYMEHVDLETYVKEYARAFRVFYNAIKSTNGSCNVYISLDQQWDRNNASSGNYDARDILDVFNREIKAEGNIDWGLAIHPYNVPLTTPYVWNATKYVKASADTPMVTMANIHIVTDYMQQEQFLTEEGEVRSVILSELGYTSSKGEEVQAAAIVYAYKTAEANKHIDSILFSRQTDAVEEIAQGLALGLNRPDGSHKYAYNVYKYMDTEQGENYTGFAKNIIGISGWGEVIKNR